MRFHAIPHTVFFRGPARVTTPRISWRIVDVDAGINDRAWPRKCVATANDEATGRRIADMMNGTNLHASHWQARAEMARANALELEKRWQGCLDVANRNAAEARGEADRLRAQLFDAREQRDEAREREVTFKGQAHLDRSIYNDVHEAAVSRTLGVPLADHVKNLEAFKAARASQPIGWTAEAVAKLIQERDEARADARNAWGELRKQPGGPHDHVVISLAGYTNLVKERDEALAKYAACVDTVSLIDGEWVKTS